MTRIEEILPLLCGEFVCVMDGKRRALRCKEELEKTELYKNHTVTSVFVQEGKLVLTLTPWKPSATESDSAWAKEYKEQTGVEPGFF